MSSGCQLPPVEYETESLRIGTEFDHPICQGTLDLLERRAERIRDAAGVYVPEAIEVFWVPGDVERICGDDRNGCYFPGTRVVVVNARSVSHEIVHAVIDSEKTAYFLEEGLAEHFAGVGGYAGQREIDLLGQFDLARSAYQRGELQYFEAAHFVGYTKSRLGDAAVERIAGALANGASADEMREVLEDLYGEPLEQVEEAWREGARRFYAGAEEPLPVLDVQWPAVVPDRPGPPELPRAWTLDCNDESTLGPLWDDRRGMYRVFDLELDEGRTASLRLTGDRVAWGYVVSPTRGLGRVRAVDPWIPDPTIDPEAIKLEHDRSTVVTEPGRYLVVLGTSQTSGRVEVGLAFD